MSSAVTFQWAEAEGLRFDEFVKFFEACGSAGFPLISSATRTMPAAISAIIGRSISARRRLWISLSRLRSAMPSLLLLPSGKSPKAVISLEMSRFLESVPQALQ